MTAQTEKQAVAPAEEDLYAGLLTVASSPHIKSGATTRRIMLDVLIALAPAWIFGICIFGLNAFLMPFIGVVSAVFFEFITQKILHKPITIGDLSAAVTGLLIGLNLPANGSYFLPAVGSAFAIIVVKQLFGGIGKNFLNPALAARVFLFLSWPTKMTSYPAPFVYDAGDIVASATPRVAESAELLDLFLGRVGGSIGEVSALCLLIGGIYLICRRVITWHIPATYIGSVALITFLLPQGGGFADWRFMLFELLSGGLMLGAIFMATDYVTSPVTSKGRMIFGVGCGLLTVFFRYFGAYPEGVSFAILVMNCLVHYIDKITQPRVFGGVKHGK